MTKELLKEYIRNLKKDTDILLKENLHPRCNDLMKMVMTEDLPEILKFLKKVEKVFTFKTAYESDSYCNGYNDGINQLRRELFDEE